MISRDNVTTPAAKRGVKKQRKFFGKARSSHGCPSCGSLLMDDDDKVSCYNIMCTYSQKKCG